MLFPRWFLAPMHAATFVPLHVTSPRWPGAHSADHILTCTEPYTNACTCAPSLLIQQVLCSQSCCRVKPLKWCSMDFYACTRQANPWSLIRCLLWALPPHFLCGQSPTYKYMDRHTHTCMCISGVYLLVTRYDHMLASACSQSAREAIKTF